MKRLWLLLSCIALLLSGCLDVEKISLSLNLKAKTAEVSYSNIVSDSKEEDNVKADFEELLKMAYGNREDKDTKPGKLIATKLYKEDNYLNGIAVYSFEDTTEMLKEYDITIDEKGDFIFDMSKEGNKDLEYISSNGVYTDDRKKRVVQWDSNSTYLKMTLKNKTFDPNKRSLLPFWLEWKEKNRQ